MRGLTPDAACSAPTGLSTASVRAAAGAAAGAAANAANGGGGSSSPAPLPLAGFVAGLPVGPASEAGLVDALSHDRCVLSAAALLRSRTQPLAATAEVPSAAGAGAAASPAAAAAASDRGASR